nr:MAG TPA_asm: hypothetical protein [Caudoviricetes sp.]
MAHIYEGRRGIEPTNHNWAVPAIMINLPIEAS